MISQEERSNLLQLAALMRELIMSEPGRAYFSKLDEAILMAKDHIVSGTYEDFENLRGVYDGLVKAKALPNHYIELGRKLMGTP